jgi:hypothetical protein
MKARELISSASYGPDTLRIRRDIRGAVAIHRGNESEALFANDTLHVGSQHRVVPIDLWDEVVSTTQTLSTNASQDALAKFLQRWG